MQNRKKNSISEKIPKKTKTIYLSWMTGKQRYLPDKLNNFDRQWPVTGNNFEACSLTKGLASARNARLYYPYWQYTNIFSIISICISTLPTQYTTFILLLECINGGNANKTLFGCFFVRNSRVALIVKLSFSKLREEKTNTFTKLSLIAEHANVSCKESTTRNKQFEDLE